MSEFVVQVQAETVSREDADLVKLDAVGGRLATHEVAMRVHNTRVWVTVTVHTEGPGEAVTEAVSIVSGALDAVGEPAEFRAAAVWRGEEYDARIADVLNG